MWRLVQVLLVLALTLQLTVSETDLLFGDEFEPPSGRDDVNTNLNLSPWELFVLSDLSLKLINAQCPKIDQDLMTSVNDLLALSFKQAQTPENQNEDFLPTYNHLVRCLDHVREKGQDQRLSQQGVTINSNGKGQVAVTKQEDDGDEVDVEVPEVESAEADWVAHDALTTTTTEPPVQPDPEANHSFFKKVINSISNWFKRVLRSKREVQEKLEQVETRKRDEEIAHEQERRKALIYKRARQNFANLFHSMSKIIQKTCPKAHRPEKTFLRKALLDMTAWATLDQTETISTAAKYFQRGNLLEFKSRSDLVAPKDPGLNTLVIKVKSLTIVSQLVR
ncbi:unnamed protein product [Orchesella dallaii]|uniref:Uncharacterized protein n=1 Tax=Orchesella dallaii TaxID=48710 RepID=A0ABP1QFN6_9HEXA